MRAPCTLSTSRSALSRCCCIAASWPSASAVSACSNQAPSDSRCCAFKVLGACAATTGTGAAGAAATSATTGGGSAQRASTCCALASAAAKAWPSTAVTGKSLRDSCSACAVVAACARISASPSAPGKPQPRCNSASTGLANASHCCSARSSSPCACSVAFKRSRSSANSCTWFGSRIAASSACQPRSSATSRFAGIGDSCASARAASSRVAACARDSRCFSAPSRRCLAARCTRRSELRSSRSACLSASSPASASTAASLISTTGASTATRNSAASSPNAAWTRGAHCVRASSSCFAFASAFASAFCCGVGPVFTGALRAACGAAGAARVAPGLLKSQFTMGGIR